MADLDIVLVPCGGHEWLVLPQSIVGRVYPYAPALSAENASAFVVGSMLVQNEKMPVLDFRFAPRETEYEGIYRIVLVSTITNQSSFRRYAIISSGEPELTQIREEDIQKLSDGNHPYVHQYVQIAGQEEKHIALLNLPLFEAELRMR